MARPLTGPLAVCLLLLLLGGSAGAGPERPAAGGERVTVVFETDPPGAEVYHAASGAARPDGRDEAWAYLGRSGGPVAVDTRPFQDPVGGFFLPHQSVRFVLAGHRDVVVTVEPEMWSAHRWPLDGTVVLPAATSTAALVDGARRHAWLLVLGGACTAGAAVWARRRGRGETAAPPAESGRRRIGRYEVIGVLGQGAMGTVFEARDDADGETWAVKVLQERFAQRDDFLERFEREFRVCAALHHPNIVHVREFGYDAESGDAYMVMERVSGVLLKTRIQPPGLGAAEGLRVLAPIFNAIAFAHCNGVVHRDIKPSNVMLTAGGVPKMMDFGIARKDDITQITMHDMAMGTPAYMAPELLTGTPPGPLTDQYSLGVLAFEVLSGRLPFDTDGSNMFAHFAQERRRLGTLRPDLAAADGVLARMLSASPTRRYDTVDQALAALTSALTAAEHEPAEADGTEAWSLEAVDVPLEDEGAPS